MAGYPPGGMAWGALGHGHGPAVQQLAPRAQQALPIEALGLGMGSRIEVSVKMGRQRPQQGPTASQHRLVLAPVPCLATNGVRPDASALQRLLQAAGPPNLGRTGFHRTTLLLYKVRWDIVPDEGEGAPYTKVGAGHATRVPP
jgi:hypothetical protein